MVGKNKFLLITTFLLVLSFLISINFIFGLIMTVTPSSAVNRSTDTVFNFTFNNTDTINISRITITLPMEARFTANSNGTDATGTFFSNTTGGFTNNIALVWTNTTGAGFISNGSQRRSFWFTGQIRNLQSTFFTNVSVNVSHISGADNLTSYNFMVNFAFSGFTRNETGGAESNANISIYQFVIGQNGPPTETLEASVLSDSNGMFQFASLNGSASLYTLKIIRYGSGGCASLNTSCNATKISTILPAFPPIMYYPTTADLPIFEFMRPPSLNGTNFYLQPAAILRLSANNISNAQKFGYEVIDQVTGFPIDSNIMNSVTTKDIIVPTGRNMTVMFTRMSFGQNGFAFASFCDGTFLNDSNCPTPPISNSTIGTLTQGQITIVNQSLIISQYRLWGCVNVTAGYNNSNVNLTSIIPRMVPWPGFVPPIKSDLGDLNLSNQAQLNNSDSRCPGFLAFYNISVIGATGGVNYLIEFYAKNASNDAGNPGSAWNLGAFQNVSISNHTNINISLVRLVGSYNGTQSDVNTSKMRIRLQNSTGGAITNSLNANIKIKNPVSGTITYMIESMSNGVFLMPILNNSNWAKVMIFANDAPPKEITLNLSKNEINITLVTMTDGNGVGMKKINSSGGMEMINSSELNSTKNINLRFLRNTGNWGSGCNVLDPDTTTCALTNTSAKNFNPLTALVAGKVNMEMKITSTNVTLTFVNFDMFAAKQPPMDSIINDNASSGGASNNQIWQFGSFAPINTYESAIIGMPYQDSVINDSNDINMSVPLLYNEDWQMTWNVSRGDTSANLSDDFTDYNSSSLYRNYLTAGGINCSKSDSNLNVIACFINLTTNMIYMRVPHFSGVGNNIIGTTAPSTAAGTPVTTTSGGGGGTPSSVTLTKVIGADEFQKGAIRVLKETEAIKVFVPVVPVGGTAAGAATESHLIVVTDIDSTAKKVTIEVRSATQTAVLSVGESKKFDANGDGYLDILVKLNSIDSSNKASLTVQSINEKIETAITPSGTTAAAATEEGALPETSSSIWIWIILGIIIVLIIAAIIFFLKRSKKNFYVSYKRK